LRQGDLVCYALLRFLDKAAYIPPSDIALDDDASSLPLARDGRWSFDLLDVGELLEWDSAASCCGDEYLPHGIGVASVPLREAHDKVEPSLVFTNLTHRYSSNGLHEFKNVPSRHAVASNSILVNANLKNGLPRDLLDVNIGVS
jgi:hypothetical protein